MRRHFTEANLGDPEQIGVRFGDGIISHYLFFTHGHFTLWMTAAVSASDLDVAQRFAEVFGFAFSRMQEIAKMEKEVRQAERRAAADRVRSEIATMRTSADLERVTPLIWKRAHRGGCLLLPLWRLHCRRRATAGARLPRQSGGCAAGGVEPAHRQSRSPGAISIFFVDESAEVVVQYTSGRGKGGEMLDSPRGGTPYPIEEWMAGKVEGVHSIASKHYEIVSASGRPHTFESKDFAFGEDRWFITNVPFRGGMVGYREREHHPEHDEIVAELAGGLELGFLRFFDFQKVEQQNRALIVEQALERVRTSIAGMDSSGGIEDLIDIVGQELRDLGTVFDVVGINTINLDTEMVTFRTKKMKRLGTEGLGRLESVPKEVLDVSPMFSTWCRHWADRRAWHRLFTITDFEAEIPTLARLGGVDEETVRRKITLGRENKVPLAHRVLDVYFDHGSLVVTRTTTREPFTDIDIALLERFTEVFALGYRRHLDLTAAEDRARLSNLDRARQRVRSEVMSMKTADDIENVVAVMKEELVGLGVACDQVGTNIVDDETGTVNTAWTSILDVVPQTLVATDVSPSPETRLLEHYRRGEVWSRARSEDTPGEPGWVVDVPFQYGTLAMNRGRTDPEAAKFAQDEIEILGGFAEAVSLGYTRFLDFQKLEAESERARIERAAERIRSEAMAMTSTKDLVLVSGLLVHELRDLGIRTKGCMIHFLDEAHDLRTPMNAIIGYTRILLRRTGDRLDDREQRNLQNTETSSNNLLQLINEILDLSRIEAGHVDLHIQPVDLHQLADECADALESIVQERVNLRRELTEVGQIQSDPDRLRQVIMNLVGNATKFTEKGSITLSVRPVEDGVEVTVADTGVGIPTKDLAHIFDEFRQVEREGAEAQGTGLGLAIVKKSVELLGGTISVESEMGKGTKFTLRITDYEAK